jgi:shikimate kinase
VVNEKWLIIGHRGVGKTSFLKRYGHLFSKTFDLDAEIEKRAQKKIPEIFEAQGEASFRALEEQSLRALSEELKDETSAMIVLGAGYCSSFWPESFKCLWLQRDSDQFPRFFLDRPFVGTSDPINFEKNFREREIRYQAKADFVWTLREGEGLFDQTSSTKWIFEDFKFEDTQIQNDCVLTVFPQKELNVENFIQDRKDWNLVFEFRNDLWSFENEYEKLKKIILKFPHIRFLFSFRRIEKISLEIFSFPNVLSDWDINLGQAPKGLEVSYFSLHDFTQPLEEELRSLDVFLEEKSNSYLKVAPVLSSFEELRVLYEWWKKNPSRKNIFPRSLNSHHCGFEKFPKWQWFRLYMKGKQRLNFLREGREGLADQPTLHQWNKAGAFESFAAILGDPVVHSYSPVFHADFFKKKKMNFFAIPLSKEELNDDVFFFLESLGACAYAVTSPLKKHDVLLKNSSPLDLNADKVLNTLFKNNVDSVSIWKRANTDLTALKKMLTIQSSELSNNQSSWVIWGSGAIAEQAFDLLENVELSSASRGNLIKKKGTSSLSMNLLWAAGDEAPLPSFKNIQKVFDLSYTFKSQARLYCFYQKIPYLSGKEFFEYQGQLQQIHWSSL